MSSSWEKNDANDNVVHVQKLGCGQQKMKCSIQNIRLENNKGRCKNLQPFFNFKVTPRMQSRDSKL